MVLSLFEVGLSGGQLDLEPDVLQNWQEHLAEDLAPKALAKVGVLILKRLLKSIETIIANLLSSFCNQACEVAKDREPELLRDAQTNGLGRCWRVRGRPNTC